MMVTAPPPGEISEMPEEPTRGNAHWLAQFTRAEREEILSFDDRKSWLTLAVNWGGVFGAMALVGSSSGLWLLLIFIPVIGFLVLLVFLVLPGEDETNEYGPVPSPTPS